MVPAAVDLPVLEEVDEIDQQLAAGDALEALRVPAAAVTCPARKHSYVSAADLPAALHRGTAAEGATSDVKLLPQLGSDVCYEAVR